MKLGHPPIAPMMPVAMIGISARPADALPGRLQQLREDAEGGRADVFALGPLLLGPLRRSQIERGGFHRARNQAVALRNRWGSRPTGRSNVGATSGSSGPGHET